MKELSAADRITDSRSSVALGIFDGVHRGHRAVIGRAVGIARESGFAPAVCTFQTATVTTKGADYRPIYSDETKCALLGQERAAYVYMPDFALIRDMSAENFVRDILVEKMNAGAVVCGRDFRFGKNASCGTDGLDKICKGLGIALTVVEDVSDNGVRISSAEIRNLIRAGRISDTNRLLGHDYAVVGEVISGNHFGRQMNFPTANQTMRADTVLPKFGVYASYAEIDGKIYRGVTNIGVKPTVDFSGTPLSETHFPSYSGDLYGRRLTVRLVEFIRPEKRFDSTQTLKNQIGLDTQTVMCAAYPVSAL